MRASFAIVATAILLGGGAGVLGGALAMRIEPPDQTVDDEFADVRALIAAQKVSAESTLASKVALTLAGEADLRGGIPYSGSLYMEVALRGRPEGAVTSVLEGAADANGAFVATGEVHGVELGDVIAIRLHTSKPHLEGPAVSTDVSQVLRAARAVQITRDFGAAGIGASVGKVRLLPPLPIATIYVDGSPGVQHVINVAPAMSVPGTPEDHYDLLLPGLQSTDVYSWFPADDWLLSGEINGVAVHGQGFRRGDDIIAEPIELVAVTGVVDPQVIAAGADIVFFAQANYVSALDAGVRRVADVVYRNFVENQGWQADASVDANGGVGPVLLVPGYYVIEAWGKIEASDDLTLPAPAPLATKSVYIDANSSAFTLP